MLLGLSGVGQSLAGEALFSSIELLVAPPVTPLMLPLLLIAVVATDGGPLAGLGECDPPPPRCMKRNGDFERRLLEVMVEVISLFNWSAGLGERKR